MAYLFKEGKKDGLIIFANEQVASAMIYDKTNWQRQDLTYLGVIEDRKITDIGNKISDKRFEIQQKIVDDNPRFAIEGYKFDGNTDFSDLHATFRENNKKIKNAEKVMALYMLVDREMEKQMQTEYRKLKPVATLPRKFNVFTKEGALQTDKNVLNLAGL